MLIVVGASDISAIAERIRQARVEVERMGVCPLSPNFYEGLGEIYEDLYVHISEIEEEINRGNYSVLLSVKEDLDKVKSVGVPETVDAGPYSETITAKAKVRREDTPL